MKAVMRWGWMLCLGSSCAALSGCGTSMRESEQRRLQQEAQPANRMLAELCKTAGEKIYGTRGDVEGIFLFKVRPKAGTSSTGQYDLTDPYGKDYGGETYIRTFLEGNPVDGIEATDKFIYVEVKESGKFYRYRLPWVPLGLSDEEKRSAWGKSPLVKEEVPEVAARYGVDYEDISTPEQRRLWIAGSALRIKDVVTGEVLAERIGYMADLYQGSRNAPRPPWVRAADVACPGFRTAKMDRVPGFVAQRGQTARFVFNALTPMPAEVAKDRATGARS